MNAVCYNHLDYCLQVHFANPSRMEEGGGEMESVAEITTLEGGARHTLVVPSTRHTYGDQTSTEVGTVQLVQIRIPGESEGQPAWINILPSSSSAHQ